MDGQRASDAQGPNCPPEALKQQGGAASQAGLPSWATHLRCSSPAAGDGRS